ncbi:glycosyltransferase family 2 protein [Pseudaestuariivita sp.]|uniref:glycosyltransferase family 2 protein n=1 Tax=Pseudaestuariivita sp. TaxID=2211669 RepID=UPI00405A0204
MPTVCLATIPARAPILERVLLSLLRQSLAPDQIIVSWCRRYRRFPGTFDAPRVPDGITLFETKDLGPLTKLAPLPTLTGTVVWCDDDCLYSPRWLETLCAARGEIAAASCFDVERLKRLGPGLVAQGFAGVRAPVEALADVLDAPDEAIWADDVWISGAMAAKGYEVSAVPEARAKVTPLKGDAALQDLGRKDANQAAAEAVSAQFGIWPPAP